MVQKRIQNPDSCWWFSIRKKRSNKEAKKKLQWTMNISTKTYITPYYSENRTIYNREITKRGEILQSNHYISAHLHTRWFLRSNLLIPSSQIIPGKNINPSWLLDLIHFSSERQRRLRYEENNSFFSGINSGGSWVEVYIYILSPSLRKIQK